MMDSPASPNSARPRGAPSLPWWAHLAVALTWAAALAACPAPPGGEDDGGAGDGQGAQEEVAPDDADAAWGEEVGPGDAQPRASLGVCDGDEACAALAATQGATPSGSCLAFRCVQGACVEAALPDGAPCDLGLCQGAGTCSNGSCVAGPATCDDDNPCTTDQCDPASGCVHTFNQLPCDDGDACTTGDACELGTCRGEVVTCDDGESCTEDACDPSTGACTFTAREGPCDDGDACTAGDTCVSGQCQPGAAVSCDDGEACTEEHCEPAIGCVTTPLTGPCDDGNACTTDTHCTEGKCLGILIQCDDGELCTSDYCDPAAGCVFEPNLLPCDDGDPCTLDDRCAAGTCVPGPPDPLCCVSDGECNDQDPCTTDACVGGYCAFTPLDCDDGAPCTVDTCADGICAHEPLGAWGSGPLWSDGFEDAALPGWDVVSDNPDVTWQRDPGRGHGGSASLYCGDLTTQSYEFGKTRAEATRAITLPAVGDLTLRLWAWLDVSESSCSYDFLTVTVNGEALDPPLCETTDAWVELTFDLTTWAGQTITLGLVFDTTDDIANNGQGVWIDDLAVEGAAPAGCCAVDEDCQGGVGCLAEVCLPDVWACGVPAAADACQDDDPCTEDLCDDTGTCQHPQSGSCCTQDADCPGAPDKPCAVPTCGPDGLCALDESLCCAGDASPCPPHAQGDCAVASCSPDGRCEYDTSACPAGG